MKKQAKDLNRHLSQKYIQTAIRYMKDIQLHQLLEKFKTTMRCHFIPVRMAIMDNKDNDNCLEQLGRKTYPHSLLVGIQAGTTSMENSKDVPKILRIQLPYDPAIPLLGIYPQNLKTLIHKDICTLYFHCSIINSGQDMETI